MGPTAICLLTILLAYSTGYAFADQGTYVDDVKFIQYLDENTALEEVRNGNLDLYYFSIPSDRLEGSKARDGLAVFDSTGGSYSLLVNPAPSEQFNLFSLPESRYALNYLVDRKLIVNELMGGFGTIMVSNYGPHDPDYLTILEQVESFNFEYNPALANTIISDSLKAAGATKIDDIWSIDGSPISITIFIRSDDPVRKSIGEILGSELEKLGFLVEKDYGDLNKAFVVVYGSDPADLQWSIYTEGWGGRSAFVRYDSLGLGQMYAPWFSSMPGFNNPSYWNYENDLLDSVTQKIYVGNFSSSDERAELIQAATIEGVNESVRIFLAGKIDQYVASDSVNGIINDFGAGVPSRFTPINSRTGSDSLVIGVKQIYQGSWNPVMGLGDSYSTHIWNTLYDPGIFRHPYTGENIPVRSAWDVETAGPDDSLTVPADAIIWDTSEQQWRTVPLDTQATSKVTFDLVFSDWHHGEAMDMNDIMYSLYFALEWSSEPHDKDKTFDSEYTPRAAQTASTLVGVRPVDHDTIEVYVDYWHFDESEIASWASVWSAMPWEIYAAMEHIVLDGKASFSRSGAVSSGVNWLSLIIPHDAMAIKDGLESLKSSGIPPPLVGFGDAKYVQQRYDAAINWIDSNNHAVISNGPFYLDGYFPESRTIRISTFDDKSYPFPAGFWSSLENAKYPRITGVHIPDIVSSGQDMTVQINTEYSSNLYYFFTDGSGDHISSGVTDASSGITLLNMSNTQTRLLSNGANDLKLFAVSDNVLRPDIFYTSFLAVNQSDVILPAVSSDIPYEQKSQQSDWTIPAIVFVLLAAVVVWFVSKRPAFFRL